jgi:Cdc6-like AAA superfamily ATPase
LDKYGELQSKPTSAGKKVRRAWKRLKWEPEDICELRNRISSNVILLNTFNGRWARDNTVKLLQHQDEQQNRTVLDWLTPVDFAAQQSDVISRRQEGTGIWFTNSPKFLSWIHGSNQTLFCPGIPGAGKTMIAAIAIDHLWKHVQNKDVGVAYIYCNYKTQADQTAAKLAAAILKQLIQERPSIAEPVLNLYDRHVDRKTRPSLKEILSALQAVVSNYSKIYVIVDALDECLDRDGSRSQLLAILRNLQYKGNLSLMATSRFIPELVQKFSLTPILEIRASDSDVRLFVAGQMDLLPRFIQRSGELQKAIQDGISTAVDGM